MVEIHYKRSKLIRYNVITSLGAIIFLILAAITLLDGIYLLASLFSVFFILCFYTEIYLLKTFGDKWIVRFDDENLITNKSLGSLTIPRSDIISITGYYQQGSYYQIGIKIKNTEEHYKKLKTLDRLNMKMNKTFTKYNLIIPGYMIKGNPHDICEELNVILAYD